MTPLTIEISDELMARLESMGRSLQDIVMQALERYIQAEDSAVAITQTRTWQLCGALEVSEPEPEYICGRDEQGQIITFARWLNWASCGCRDTD
jgi:hypothetical protein